MSAASRAKDRRKASGRQTSFDKRGSSKQKETVSQTYARGQAVLKANPGGVPSGGSSGPSAQLKALSIANSPTPKSSSSLNELTNLSIGLAQQPGGLGKQYEGGRGDIGQNKSGYSSGRPTITQDTINSGGFKPGGAYDFGGVQDPNATTAPYVGRGNAKPPAWAVDPSASGVEGQQGLGQSNVGSANQALISALQATAEERGVQGQQDDADRELRNLNRGQDQANRNISDQPIAKPFITGQQAAVAEQYGIDRGGVQDRMQTLQAKLARLQAQRQASIDVAKIGLDEAKYKDTQAQQSFSNQNMLSQQQLAQQQQQYQNSTSNSRYTDSQTQQQLDNTYRQQQANIDNNYRANNSTGASDKQTEKEMASLRKDSAGLISKLGLRSTDWGTAWNSLRTKYPQASNELLDEMLQKDKYYTTTVKSKNDTSGVGYFNPASSVNRVLGN